MELRRIRSLHFSIHLPEAFLLPLFALLLTVAFCGSIFAQASPMALLQIPPGLDDHTESDREDLTEGHAAPESDHNTSAANTETLAESNGSILPARIALTDSDSRRRDESLRRIFEEPRRWIFHVTEASAQSSVQVAALRLDPRPVTGSSFDPTPPFIDDPPLHPKDSDTPDSIEINTGFQWRPAINQSMMLLGIQHGYALIAQEKTRQALKGPFFRDYWRSLKGLRGWDDGNRFFTNYIAHPMQGGLTGFIYVQNSPRAMRQQFGESKEYWKDRFTAFLWSTAWSTQFELGPISQSTIGNLGMYGGMAYVDLVITPTVGTGWLISEEALDRYVIRKLETYSFVVKMFLRSILNPMRSVANVLRFREPWYRDRPFGY